MKLTGFKHLEPRPKRTARERLAYIPVILFAFLVGSAGFGMPLTWAIFGNEYSGMLIAELLIGLTIGIWASVKLEKYRSFCVAATIAFVVGAGLTYAFMSIAYPGELITGY
ncbi:MAG: hypothetical protein KIG36_07205 [Eubacteriales bacterium]|nr:hypothetical protein [Eubacteriales bacterium]